VDAKVVNPILLSRPPQQAASFRIELVGVNLHVWKQSGDSSSVIAFCRPYVDHRGWLRIEHGQY
jgi:hypothetical protein